MEKKTALITGANAGIGLALADRLLTEFPSIHLCLACRSKSKAEEAQTMLKEKHEEADICVLLVDVSNLESVYRAAEAIKKQYKHIDYLYLNAGIMPVSSVDWSHFWQCLFSSKCVDMFRTGDGLLKQVDGVTTDGMKQIFATNLFGHFALLKKVNSVLGGANRTTQVIWTSSSNAKKSAFMLSDIQHQHGSEPYSSSKYATDMISVALNERFNQQGIYSHTTCPGLVMTNLTYGILPSWFWTLLLPLLILIRIFTPTMNYSPYNGSEALVWLAKQPPQGIDPMCKYHSRLNWLGNRYVEPKKVNSNFIFLNYLFEIQLQLDVDISIAQKAYEELDKMETAIHKGIKLS
ncbi:hypothetical protein CAPTEDRAFT_92645 [Capitella teleta]|uniref:3-keto-steroid reductase/17-beta-hydroxysteroid dehydrogenase 7 n=1 Tax=Capitella teleta TaxID=283909 RepID=R7VJ03_CAPTE|nr:hypothetical protein CAPTEDRAFT_92645 [Capitella teleta]|eukprot:ELU18542.1 hypothetical protein CAPTEDRAFT_92645 [Capitella teleta]